MAERSLNSILTDINTNIKTVSFGGKITTWGLCYQQIKDEKTFPLLNTGSRNGQKISWDDKYPLQTYHRIIDVTKETDVTKGFGSKVFRQRVYKMRLVGVGNRQQLTSSGYEDNQEFAKTISDVLPSFLSNKEYLEVTDYEVIKNTVYEEEFNGVEKNKTLSLEGIAFWIDYTLKINIC
jgi:hypothetical protein